MRRSVRRRLCASVVGGSLLASLVVLAPAAPSGADGNDAPGAPLAFRSLSVGATHTCAVLSTGDLRCWGDNDRGQLGLGDTVSRGDDPNEMGLALPKVDLGTGRTVTTVAVSENGRHSCALLDNGTVKCWGQNDRGQLGLGDTADRGDGPGEMGDNLPAVNLGTGRTATAVSVNASLTCALLDNGTVKCWGYNQSGQLGLGDGAARGDGANEMGDNLPTVNLGTGRTATSVSVGVAYACALLDDASVKCWGAGGWLGLGDTATRGLAPTDMGDNLPAIDLGTGRSATAISAGGGHTCALLDDASVKCWGFNPRGELGLGNIVDRGDDPGEMGDALPAVNLGTGRTALGISAGQLHTCALLDDHSIKCWGYDERGTLGVGDTNDRGDGPGEMGDNLPAVSLGTGRSALAVSAGNRTCAVLDDGSVKCWGEGYYLGLGDHVNRGDNPNEMGDALPPVLFLGPAIAGHVKGTGDVALAGSMVAALRTTDFALVAGGNASSTGEFGFAVPAGSYFLYVIEPTGSFTAGFMGAPTTVVVTSQTVVADPVLLAKYGSVGGTVTETGGGSPIPNAVVIALSAGGLLERAVAANASGQFTIDRLRPGTHHVAYLDPTGDHAVRFHPSAATIDGDTPLTVTAGTLTFADGNLPAQTPVGTGQTLFGHVTESATNARLAGIVVFALRASNFSLARSTRTNANGGYTLNLAAGSYVLGFLDPSGQHATEWFDDQPASNLAGATPVAAPGVADAALARTTGSMAGTITVSGTAAAAAWVIAVGPSGVAGATVTHGDGTYRIDGLPPDNYRVAFVHPPTGRYEYWNDTSSYQTASDISVGAGDVAPVDADL